MKDSYKIALFVATVVLLAFLAWREIEYFQNIFSNSSDNTEVVTVSEVSNIENNIDLLVEQNFEGEVDPVWMVRGILARASENNENTVWERGMMSEPTLVADILENEHAWMAARDELQNLLMIDDTEEMNVLWQELSTQKMVGEWETVVAEKYYPNTL